MPGTGGYLTRRVNTELARQRRRELHLTQAALATEIGVNLNVPSRWERGVATPTADNLVAWARLLGLEPTDLLIGPMETAP